MEQKPSYDIFRAYCIYIRKAFSAKGILIYNAKASKYLGVIGYPFAWSNAVNDNEVKL